jgi:hypothetical protein
LRLPSGSIDEQAAALAKAVVAGDDSSIAALYAAILASGYGVRDSDGSVLQTTEQKQGLAFNAWEVAATAKLYGQGYGVTLGHLSDAFTRNVPAFKDVPLANALLEGIRAGAKSAQPAVRFWARFIVELGRNSAAPYDLLGTVDPARIRLDAAQFALILSRLTGDLAVLEKQQGQITRPNNDITVINGRKQAELHHVAFHRTRSGNHLHGQAKSIATGMKLPNDAPGGEQSPCTTTENQDLILSYDALASTTLFGVLTNRLGGNIEKYGGKAGIANIVLAVAKFIASYALLKVEITMDADKLVRTQDTHAGKSRTLTAKLLMDTGKWQSLNCLRPVLNAAGLDFDLPGDGPLDGVKVEWLLVMGGDDRSVLDRLSQSDTMRILNAAAQSFLSGDPAARIENTNLERSGYGNAIVSLEHLPGTDSSMAKQYTDADGVSRIRVIGTPQQKDLSHEKLTERYEVAGVRVDVQLKSMKIENKKDLVSNVGDIAGNVISFLTGDFLGGAVGTAAETLYRSNWYRSEPFYFLVKDWEPCTGQWTGTITVTEGYKYTDSFKDSHRWAKTTRTETYSATLTVGERTDSQSGQINLYNATVKTEGGYTETEDSAGLVQCWKAIHTSSELSGHSDTQVGVAVTVNPDMTYRVNYSLPTLSITGLHNVSSHLEGPDCHNPFMSKGSSSSRPLSRILTALKPDIEGVLDPNNPGVLTGTKTISQDESGGKRTATVKWNLARCGSR